MLNKIVWGLMNPTIVTGIMVLVGAVLVLKGRDARRRTWGARVLVAGLALMWLWMTPQMTRILGLPLEHEWLVDGKVPRVESFPEAEAIVLLGGGMGGATNASPYAEMRMSADRVWQAARLYKAGKASRIFVTGKGNEFATKGLLADFGVPTNAMVFVDQARNTEEEAKAVAVLCSTSTLNFASTRLKVLLVTSAWHMRRALLMFEKYAPGLDALPAPTDFETTVAFSSGFSLKELIPNGLALASNECFFHERLGCWAYKYFR